MSVPNIDTFEHDIRNEITNREASIGDIVSARGEVSNALPDTQTSLISNRKILLGIGVLVAVSIVSFSILGYIYFVQKPITQKQAAALLMAQNQASQTEDRITSALNAMSPALQTAIGQYAKSVNTNAYGTTIGITSYTTVFANMIRSESSIARDMLAGKYTSDPQNPPTFVFTDLTQSNQSMRIVSVGSTTLMYAFVGEKYLVFARSVEGILSLRGSLNK